MPPPHRRREDPPAPKHGKWLLWQAVDPIFSYIQDQQPAIIALIRQFVECESPSDDAAAVNRFVELVSDTVAPFAKVKTIARRQVRQAAGLRNAAAGTAQVAARFWRSDTPIRCGRWERCARCRSGRRTGACGGRACSI